MHAKYFLPQILVAYQRGPCNILRYLIANDRIFAGLAYKCLLEKVTLQILFIIAGHMPPYFAPRHQPQMFPSPRFLATWVYVVLRR